MPNNRKPPSPPWDGAEFWLSLNDPDYLQTRKNWNGWSPSRERELTSAERKEHSGGHGLWDSVSGVSGDSAEAALPEPEPLLLTREPTATTRGFSDVDETPWCSTESFLRNSVNNYGRKRRVAPTEGEVASRRAWEALDEQTAAEEEFLAEGGWIIESAGTTGRPVGRPRTGVTEFPEVGAPLTGNAAELADYLSAEVDRLARELGPTLSKPDGTPIAKLRSLTIPPREFRRFLPLLRAVIVQGHGSNANTAALAERMGVTPRQIRYDRKVISPNSPKGGESNMNTALTDEVLTEAAERLEHITALEARLLRERQEIAALMRERFPTRTEVQEAVSRFLATAAKVA